MPLMISGGGGTPQTIYLFIDGGYLRKHYSESVRRWFGCDGEIDFTQVRQTYGAIKTFYYDCLDDLKRGGENESDFNLRIEQQEAFFNKIREVNGSHVRLGSLTGTAKNKRQKEVDILIAVDMLSHAVNHNMNRAVLLTGDLDFKPVVDALVQMGIFVEVAGDRKSTSKELAWAADNFIEISFDTYYQWTVDTLRKQHLIDITREDFPVHESLLVRQGLFKGKHLGLYKWPGNNNFYIHVPQFHKSGKPLTLRYQDEAKLKLYFELQYGKIEW